MANASIPGDREVLREAEANDAILLARRDILHMMFPRALLFAAYAQDHQELLSGLN